MLSTILMPKLSPTMTRGEIAKWHKNVGQSIAPGDLLAEIATDKATIEHTSIEKGWFRKILISEGQTVEVGTPIAIMSSEQDEPIEGYVPFSETKAEPKMVTPKEHEQKSPLETPKEQPSRIAASPLARKIVEKEHLSLRGITGSGPGGRIISRDLEVSRLKKNLAQGSGEMQQEREFTPEDGVALTPLSMMRSTIASTLQYAKSHIPHFYLCKTLQVSSLIAERERLKQASIHLTINDMILKACAKALMDHPLIRSCFYPHLHAIGLYPHADIGVAVSVPPSGLFTPIIRNAENKSIFAIAKEVRILAEKAKQGKLLPNEYTGGAFTITNLGMYSVDFFFPIINPPQVAILAIGTLCERPIVKNGNIGTEQMLPMTLAADHRAVDGAQAADFLKTVESYLNSPQQFLEM